MILQIWVLSTVAIKRVGAYLLLPEQPALQEVASTEVLLTFTNACVGWPKSKTTAAALPPAVGSPASASVGASAGPPQRETSTRKLRLVSVAQPPALPAGQATVAAGGGQGKEHAGAPAMVSRDSGNADHETSTVLPSLSMDISPGSLVAVVGPVRSGVHRSCPSSLPCDPHEKLDGPLLGCVAHGPLSARIGAETMARAGRQVISFGSGLGRGFHSFRVSWHLLVRCHCPAAAVHHRGHHPRERGCRA